MFWIYAANFYKNTFSKDHLWTAAFEARNFIQSFCKLKKFSMTENAQQHWGQNYFTPDHLQHFKQTLNLVWLTEFCKSFVFIYKRILWVGCPLYFSQFDMKFFLSWESVSAEDLLNLKTVLFKWNYLISEKKIQHVLKILYIQTIIHARMNSQFHLKQNQ